MNIAVLLNNTSAVFNSHPAVMVGSDVVYTYGRLFNRVSRLAGGLIDAMQLKPGDRVALAMGNHPAYFEVLFAIWHAGLAAVPVNAKLHVKEMAYIIDNSGSKVCFATEDVLAGNLHDECSGIDALERIICVDDAEYEKLFSNPVKPRDVGRDDLAWLFYTSGTTGRPKGAMLSHLNLQMMSWSFICDMGPLTEKDTFILLGPQSHAAGFIALSGIAKGCRNILPASGGFDTREVATLINDNEGVSFFASPTMLRRMVSCSHIGKTSRENIKSIMGGGAPFFAADVKEILARFGYTFTNGYGQGECPCTITAMPRHFYSADMSDEELVSVGIARSGTRVKIVDETGRELPDGSIGEIIVQSDIVMLGYWKDTQATGKALKNGWLYTGDMGVFNENGFLTLKDRSKDVIISGGANIYPSEVENVLLTHNAISDVAVVGRHDDEWGEKVVAYVETRPGMRVSGEELDELCRKSVARFKRPREYKFIDSMPRNSTGKIIKTMLN